MSEQEQYPFENPALKNLPGRREIIFEQYKLYVETTTKVTEWRNATNAFFLTLNSLIITIIGMMYDKDTNPFHNPWMVVLPALVAIVANFVWYRLIGYYKDLNEAKFKVVEDFEKLLPVMPFVNREWKCYLEQNDQSKLDKVLSDYERWLPVLFAIVYGLGALAFAMLN